MSTIATTTNTSPLVYPSTTLVDRDPTTGHLYAMVKESTANNYTIYRSTNGGTSWAAWSNVLTRTNLTEIGSIFASGDSGGVYIWWCYRTNESGEDRIWFQRNNNGVWGGEVLLGNASNGGTAGSVYQGIDLHIVGQSDGSASVAVAAGFTLGASHGARLFGCSISPGGTTAYVNSSLIAGTQYWLYPGSGRITPSLDIEHIGDGRSAPSTPNLWLAFGRTKLHMVKCAWNFAGWTGPTTATVLQSTIPTQDFTSARWDGNEFYAVAYGVVSTDTVNLYERNRANSTTTIRTTPPHPTGAIRSCTLSYNAVTRDCRIYATGTSTAVLYYIDFIRATGSWTTWNSVLATAVLGSPPINHGVRRGSWGNSRYDVYTAQSGAPNTLLHTQQTLSYAPNTPTWTSPSSGQAANVSATLVLSWLFSDPDSSDTQSAYALSRQIGAGAIQYWNAGTSTWGGSEIQNSSGTSSVTLPTAWGSGGDSNHTYKVKVWDSASTASSYSAALVIVPSVVINPAITAPAAAAVLTTDHVTVTWTAAEQTAYRVTLVTNPGSVTVFQSGWVTDAAARTYTVPYVLPDATGWQVWLETKNNEGLGSSVQTRAFTVDYIEAPAPTIVATAFPTSGLIRVVITNPAAVGAQPAVSSQDLWRRIVGEYSTALNPNPNFETNITGWTAVGGTGVRDSAQAHEGSWSAKITPTGGIADSYIESAKFAVTQGSAYTATAWVRPNTNNKPVALWIRWYTATPTLVSITLVTSAAIATAWQFLHVSAIPPVTATQASIAVGVTSTAAATDIVYADEVELAFADTSTPIRVATGLSSGATFDDWRAVSLTPYEYRAVALGANGTSIAGPWQA